MRITLTIADELLEPARIRAQESGVALDAIIEPAWRRELDPHTASQVSGPTLPVFTTGTGPQPGVDLVSTRALHELLDEHRNFDSLR